MNASFGIIFLAVCVALLGVAGTVPMQTSTAVVAFVDFSFLGTYEGTDSQGYSGAVIIDEDAVTIVDYDYETETSASYTVEGDELVALANGQVIRFSLNSETGSLIVMVEGQEPVELSRKK